MPLQPSSRIDVETRDCGDQSAKKELPKQDRYSNKPWQPGQIPQKSGYSRIPVIQRLDQKAQPCGEYFAIQKPDNAGRGKPDENGNP